jgi:thiamine-monophosphate kinase
MKELDWIRYLRKRVPKAESVLASIGDDCAWVKVGKENLLLKSDMSIEGVHFFLNETSCKTIGMRAAGRVLSDFAACGGRPLFLGVSLGKGSLVPKQMKEMLSGILSLAQRFGFSLVGGDTAKSDKVFLDVWGVGKVEKFIARSKAKAGDYIFMTNKPGLNPFDKPFTPRLREASYLSRYKINSMIDVSDGVVIDLYRILEASRKGARLSVEDSASLYRGEDYELLFTVDKSEKNINVLKKHFYLLGRITGRREGFKFAGAKAVAVRGYTHDI